MAKNRKVPESEGYDILIWQRKPQSPTWACGYTAGGAEFLRTLDKNYVQGRALEVLPHPQEVLRSAPRTLKIGGVDPRDGKVYKMTAPPLQS